MRAKNSQILTCTILGCGSSAGSPRVGLGWGACDPDNPRNRRRRCSAFVTLGAAGAPQAERTQILIDTSPDLRAQLLDVHCERLDAILMTHGHADHLHGIDDVRPLTMLNRRRIPIYMDCATSTEARQKFDYIFETPVGGQYPPLLDERRLVSGENLVLEGPGGALQVLPVEVPHGDINALGFRFRFEGARSGGLAYLPDVSSLPESAKPAFADLDLWILDALRYKPHPTHLSVSQALDLIAELRAQHAVLTNLHTDLDFESLRAQLPANVAAAYDGLILTLRA